MYVDLQLLTIHCAELVKLHPEEENSCALSNIGKPAQHDTVSSLKSGKKISYTSL
jgi:hypothetical protein